MTDFKALYNTSFLDAYVYSIFSRRPKLLLAKIGVVGIIPYEVSG